MVVIILVTPWERLVNSSIKFPVLPISLWESSLKPPGAGLHYAGDFFLIVVVVMTPSLSVVVLVSTTM
jgi:hypothetical protein